MQKGVSRLVLEGENMLWFFLFSTYKNIKSYFYYWRNSRDFGAIYNPKKNKMIQKDSVYRSILDQLGSVPKAYLQEVDTFLRNLTKEIRQKEQNRIEIMDLAGSWSDMSEKEFEDYMQAKKINR